MEITFVSVELLHFDVCAYEFVDYEKSLRSSYLTCISKGSCDAMEQLITKLADSGQISWVAAEESLAKSLKALWPPRGRWFPQNIGDQLTKRLIGFCLDANSDALIEAFSDAYQVCVPWLSWNVVKCYLVLRDGLEEDGTIDVGVGAQQFLQFNRNGWARGSAAPGFSREDMQWLGRRAII